jgi:hypothetical protein
VCPTLEDIKEAFVHVYDEPYLSLWAEWLHEQYHLETTEINPYLGIPVRSLVFQDLESKLRRLKRKGF